MQSKHSLAVRAAAVASGLLLAGSALAQIVVPPDGGMCDPLGEYKNHGEYVSCVAQDKDSRGPGPGNSSAAHSSIGKKIK